MVAVLIKFGLGPLHDLDESQLICLLSIHVGSNKGIVPSVN